MGIEWVDRSDLGTAMFMSLGDWLVCVLENVDEGFADCLEGRAMLHLLSGLVVR